jgi:hypothetical protein
MLINDFMNTDIEIVMLGPEAQMFGPEGNVAGNCLIDCLISALSIPNPA